MFESIKKNIFETKVNNFREFIVNKFIEYYGQHTFFYESKISLGRKDISVCIEKECNSNKIDKNIMMYIGKGCIDDKIYSITYTPDCTKLFSINVDSDDIDSGKNLVGTRLNIEATDIYNREQLFSKYIDIFFKNNKF